MEKYKDYITVWFVCISIFLLILDMSIEIYIKLFFPKDYYFALKLRIKSFLKSVKIRASDFEVAASQYEDE